MDDTTTAPDRASARRRPTCEVRCRGSRTAGHGMHRTQLGIVDATPWGWRSGVVRFTAVDEQGLLLVVHYVEHDVDVTLRHHLPLPLERGDVVAVHERGATLEAGDEWRSVSVVEGGLGEPSRPDEPARWPPRRRGTPDSPSALYPG